METERALQLLDAIAGAVDASRDPANAVIDVFELGWRLGRGRPVILDQVAWLNESGYAEWQGSHLVRLTLRGRKVVTRRLRGRGRLRL
jgi:hypothetical protein